MSRLVAATVIALGVSAVATRAADEWTGADEAATRELLQGASGRREAWASVPELVILSSVMDFTGDEMASGYVATGERLRASDIAALELDLTSALASLTAGRLAAFSAVRVEPVAAGQRVPMFRRGQIVVGRFRGVQAKSGTLGYGGRTTRGGAISSGAVILDAAFDSQSARRDLLRMHELGHALGFNHVESRRSVMNPRVGAELTDFDRTAIAHAFTGVSMASATSVIAQQARRQN